MTSHHQGGKARPSTREKRDDSIMNTNSSCIVSKRSVEKIYHNQDHGFLRYFVKKFQRRSPLINRGYWLRMRAIEHVVRQFIKEPQWKKKIICNLGCGYDTMPFKFLSQEKELCQNTTFVDIDYRQLILKKCEVIASTQQLNEVLKDMELPKDSKDVVLRSDKYFALACDLQKIQDLDQALRKVVNPEEDVSVLYVAEVSITYMDSTAANTLIKWASSFAPGQFCLLEQYLPDGPNHPFARTMLQHFLKLQSRLKSAEELPTLQHQYNRFTNGGWPEVHVRNLWNLWLDDQFLTGEERKALDSIEPFDEWEEFALFGCHYFLLLARTEGTTQPSRHAQIQTAGPCVTNDNLEQEVAYAAFIQHPKSRGLRRFGAAFKQSDTEIVVHGGHGERGRLQSGDVFGKRNDEKNVAHVMTFPRTEIMCHTITSLGETGDLIVGGRGSPDRPSSDCYLRKDGVWCKVGNLPYGLYRHSAVAVPQPSSDDERAVGVLVFGGKTGACTTSHSVLYWDVAYQWRDLPVRGEQPCPRSGSAIIGTEAGYGIITGGINEDGKVLSDLWIWKLSLDSSGLSITFAQSTMKLKHTCGTEEIWGRYGASLINSPWGILLMGGIGVDMIGRRDEILVLGGDWSVSRLNMEVTGPRPLLVGAQAMSTDGKEVLIVGGGAVCFSFGTVWNEGCYSLSVEPSNESYWELLTPSTNESLSNVPSERVEILEAGGVNKDQKRKPKEPKKVSRKVVASAEDFDKILTKGRPVIIEGLEIGKCTEAWSMAYLKERVGVDRKVVIHSSPSLKMDFLSKNFTYTTVSFGQFLDDVEAGSRTYLRALSADRPADQVTTLAEDFPSIAEDFKLPAQLAFVKANAHSSPLRISGPVAMWLHYDVMANVLCQIRGHKKLMLYSPRDVEKLGFPAGASSSSIDVFDNDALQNSGLGSVQGHEAALRPGDVLFVPALWAHAAQPTEGSSIAVNVFFRDLESGYAAGKDVYGNRDLQAYEQGRKDVAKIARAFQQLPSEVGQFYLTRLAMELEAVASGWGKTSGNDDV